ncbi:hypothetical protein ABEP17_10760 [Priestia flexa]|uniref:hypothetical protein n=1 Tax=Priestia flexa TaxID=86664 RepID=UPI003D2C8A2E
MNGQEMNVNEHIEYLKGTDTYKEYKRITSYSSMNAAENFFSAVDQEIEKIQKLEGPLYSEDGKKAAIREKVQELSKEYNAKAEQEAQEYNQGIEQLKRNVAKKMAPDMDFSEHEANNRLLRNEEFKAEIKNELMLASNARNILQALDSMVDQVEYTGRKTFGKYLLKNMYLFMEHIDKVGLEGNERALLAATIAKNKSRLEKLVMSDADLAYRALSEEIKNKWATGSGSSRLIEMRTQRIINKYK